MRRWLAALSVCGCLAPLSVRGQSSVWRVDPTPIVRVGTADGDTLTELVGITGVVALPNGATAVSLGRNRRLMVFDARGRVTSAAGRRGAGPGEFAGSIAAVRWSADSIIVWDSGADRWSIFAADGKFARQLSEADGQANRRRGADVAPGLLVWSYDAARGVPTWVAPLADSLHRGRLVSDVPTRARIDPQGFLWVRQQPDSSRWQVFAPSGAFVTSLVLPSGGDVVDITLDRVLLRTSDDDGFEFVQSHRLSRPANAAALARRAPLPPRVPSVAVSDTLRRWSMNLTTAQEAGFADRIRYTTNPAELRIQIPSGLRLLLHRADKRGWEGTLIHRSTGQFCRIAVGNELTIGWDEGSPICTR